MTNFLNLNPSIFGVYISSSSIGIAKVVKEKNSPKVVSLSWRRTVSGVIENGKIEKRNRLIREIKKTVENVRGDSLGDMWMVACLPEEKLFLKTIPVEEVSKKEIDNYVSRELERQTPLSVEDVYFDFELVENKSQDDFSNLIISAVSKKIADSYLEIFKEAGLKPLAMESKSHALIRFISKKLVLDDVVLIVNIDEKGAGISFFFNKSPYTQFYSSEINHILLDNLSEKWAQEKIIEELKKYIDYWESDFYQEKIFTDKKNVNKIFVFGSRKNEDLRYLIENNFNIKTFSPDLSYLEMKKKGLSYDRDFDYCGAVGLAMRNLFDKR